MKETIYGIEPSIEVSVLRITEGDILVYRCKYEIDGETGREIARQIQAAFDIAGIAYRPPLVITMDGAELFPVRPIIGPALALDELRTRLRRLVAVVRAEARKDIEKCRRCIRNAGRSDA